MDFYKTKDALKIKAILAQYFRFKRKGDTIIDIITEFRFHDIEDFVAFSNTNIYCCEVKLTMQDLRADFKTKRKFTENLLDKSFFTYFYYAVTDNICEKALKEIEQHDKRIGLISINPTTNDCGIRKSAKRLHNLTIYNDYRYFSHKVKLRSSSEKANLYENICQLRELMNKYKNTPDWSKYEALEESRDKLILENLSLKQRNEFLEKIFKTKGKSETQIRWEQFCK